ncbi:tyrosine-type recombinase/integrase [Micromonospora carbonacea]|uniref:Phage integrase family protein n=1 Tax=Micromonospora carbonacea TaxID=47853 RepID=A0A1C5ADA2_9ACTN|nr:tyrosine-type recombinase/integrase [Micromonospora carbonacea]SCF43215.1 Phage integrase family protein [Micromonospora carbonacea]
MATIEKRGSSYRVTWRLGGSRDGARQSASFTAPKPAAAHELAKRARKLVEAHSHRITRAEVLQAILGEDAGPPDGAITLADWVKLWHASREPVNPDAPGMDDIQPDTLAGYMQVVKVRILPYLGHKYLHEIDEDLLKEWVKTLKATRVRRTKANPGGKPISAQSVRTAHGVLHLVLGSAVPRFIPRNPAARPAGVRKNRVGLPKAVPFEGMFLTPGEVDRIHACCDEHIQDLWFVLTNTGIRLGEALVLRVQDITVEGDEPELRVRRALKKGGRIGLPKSAKSFRVVSISTDVAKVLAARCKGKRPRDLIFPCPGVKKTRGAEPTWAENNLNRRHWAVAVAEAMRCDEHPPPPPPKPARGPRRKLRPDEVSTCGCPGVLRRRPRMHDGRHTHASDLIRAGWQLHEVQDRLGHASPLTTLTIYGHALKGKHRARLDGLAAARLAAEDEEA